MLLIDLSNMFYRCFYILEKKYNDEVNKYGQSSFKINEKSLLEAMLKEIVSREEQFSKDYGRIILCCDSKSNWRYKYFRQYKQKRKEDKANDSRDWDFIRAEFNKAKENIAKNTKYTVLEVKDLEADDIIALSCFTNTKDNILIISVDKDLNQLIDNKRIKQYSPMTDDFVDINHHPLNEAILTGDSSDGVPNIFSNDDHYVREDKVRAKPVSSKIKEFFSNYDIIDESVIDNFVDNYNKNVKKDDDKLNIEIIKHNWNRNNKMINLKMIPNEYYDIFKNSVIESIKLSNINKEISDNWVNSIINNLQNKDESDDIDIGDLFD